MSSFNVRNETPIGSGRVEDLKKRLALARSRIPQFTRAQIEEHVRRAKIEQHRKTNPIASDIGRRNLEELLRLGDVSDRIKQAVKEREAAVKIQSIGRGEIQRARLTQAGWEQLIDPEDEEDINDEINQTWMEYADEELEDVDDRTSWKQDYLDHPWRYDLGAMPHHRRGYGESRNSPRGGRRWVAQGETRGGIGGWDPDSEIDNFSINRDLRDVAHRQPVRRGYEETRGWVRAHKPTLRRLLESQNERWMMREMMREPDDY